MNSLRFKLSKQPPLTTRFKALLEEEAVTQIQWEEVDIAAQLAKGQATRAKAGLDIATSRLQDTKLKRLSVESS